MLVQEWLDSLEEHDLTTVATIAENNKSNSILEFVDSCMHRYDRSYEFAILEHCANQMIM